MRDSRQTAPTDVEEDGSRPANVPLSDTRRPAVIECAIWAVMQRGHPGVDRITERSLCVGLRRASCRIPSGSIRARSMSLRSPPDPASQGCDLLSGWFRLWLWSAVTFGRDHREFAVVNVVA